MKEYERLKGLEEKIEALEKEVIELKKVIEQQPNLSTKIEENDKTDWDKKRTVASFEHVGKKSPGKFATKIDWERRIGQVWLPRVFIFVLLIGIIWAFKAASDYGFINEPVKVVIGYLSALILLYIGHRQINKERIGLGQVLLSGSVILLLIVTFAMHALYGMIPVIPALFINILSIGLGIFLANRFRSEPLAVLTGIGGYLIPFLLESARPSIINFVLFETIFYISLLLFAIRKRFNILYHVAFALLHVTLFIGSIVTGSIGNKLFAGAVIIQHVTLLLTFFFYKRYLKPQSVLVFTSFILMTGWIGLSFPTYQFEMCMLITFGVYLVLSSILWSKDKIRLSVTISISGLAFLIFLISKFNVENILGLLMIQGLISVFLGIRISSTLKQTIGLIVFLYSVLSTVDREFQSINSIEFLNWMILLVLFWISRKLFTQVSFIKKHQRDNVRLILNITFMILLLAFTSLAVEAITNVLSLNIQYMSVSFAWAIFAFTSIIIGAMKEKKSLRIFGMVLLFITLGKLVFFDLTYLSILIRAILFIMLGLIGVVGSRIFYKQPKE